MSTATLADIITKVRKLTGTGNSLQLTDAMIVDYINSFYLYDFPAEFRTLHLKDTYTFNTIQNIDVYAFDFIYYSTLEPPVYIDKRNIGFFTDPSSFNALFLKTQRTEAFTTGDGTTGAYSGTAESTPIIRSVNNNPMVETMTQPTASFSTGSYPAEFTLEPNPARIQNILITANTATSSLHVTDDGDGSLIGDCSAGTIDYATGAIASLTFDSAVPSGTDIEIHYSSSVSAIPQAVLFWQNQLIIRPIPDKSYVVEIVANRRPSQVLLGSVVPGVPVGTGVPELLEWWETLAAGASKKVFEDRQDEDGIQMMDKMLFERYALNETRTYAQIGKQQMKTIFSEGYAGGRAGYLRFGGDNNG